MELTTSYQKIKEIYVGDANGVDIYLRNYAKYNSQDITNNRTSVSVQLRIYIPSGSFYQQTGGNWYIGLTDSEVLGGTANKTFNQGETTLGTLTGWVNHNEDGTMTNCACLGSINFTAWTPALVGNVDVTDIELPLIQRASTLTDVKFTISNDGNTIKIKPTFTKYVDTFYQKLLIKDTNWTTTLITLENVASGTEYTLNSSQRQIIYDYIDTNTQYLFSCDLYTYVSNGGSLVGAHRVKRTATLPNYTISTTATITDTISTYDTYKPNNHTFIAYLSKPQFDFTTTSSTGTFYGRTPIYKLNNNVIVNPYTVNNYTGQNFTFNITDGRKSTTYTPSSSVFTKVEYFKPTIVASVVRPSPTGDKIVVTVSGKYYSGTGLTNLETPSVTFKYQETGSGEISTNISVTTSTSGNVITFSGTKEITGLNYRKSIVWVAKIKDKVNKITQYGGTLPQGMPVFYVYLDNQSVKNTVTDGILHIDEIRTTNLFNVRQTPTTTSRAKVEALENGLYIEGTSDGNYMAIRYIIFDLTNYKGKTITLTSDIIKNTATPRMIIGTCDANTDNRVALADTGILSTSGKYTITATLPTTVTSTNQYMYLDFALTGSASLTAGVNSKFENIQLNFGTNTEYHQYIDFNFNHDKIYSATETRIGTFIFNNQVKDVYRVTTFCDPLPNAQQQAYNHNATNVDIVLNVYGCCTNGMPVNVSRPNGNTGSIGCWFDKLANKIKIETGTDRSSLGAYITMEYTKTR